jgi:hypothetical protein
LPLNISFIRIASQLKPEYHLHKYARKYKHIYTLTRALVILVKNLGIFPTVQQARKHVRIYAHIYASGIQALGTSASWLFAWKTLEEDYITFLLPAPKCTNCINQVLMLQLSKTDF